MRRSLFIALVAGLGFANQVSAQDKTMMVTAGPGLIGPGCTNCGILPGIQSTFDYGVLDRITVGATFNYYFDKDDAFGIVFKETVMHTGAAATFYFKERFKGFYLSPDFGFISYKLTYGATESVQNNFTFGGSMGWHISIADLIIINPFMGYGSWFENSKGRIEMGVRLGVKF